MIVNKFEAVGIAISIGAMALALWLIRVDDTARSITQTQPETEQAASVVAANEGDQNAALADAILDGSTANGTVQKLIIDDVVFGTGPAVVEGDTVRVHYIGSLQNGQQFDNSYVRSEPFTFTVGEGRVIAGWERGLLGMQAGGQRVLVVPAELAYGDNGSGPIPPDATLVFAIELLAIEE